MRDARLVGLSPDGKSLIVATETGEELAIAADERLRAAVRGDRPRLGQLEIEMKSALSPRDIQARIRAGESLEEVGRIAGLPLDRVERFAAPVLAEREHIAAQAMSASVRRRGESSGHRGLRVTVNERLLSRGVDIDTIAWDAYRLDDGRWAVTADYRSGESSRHATFTFDARGRFSVASNDEAHWLLSEQPAATNPQPGRRRSAEAADFDEDNEPTLNLSDDLALVRATQERDRADDHDEEEEEPTVTLRRRLRPVADLPPDLGGDGFSEDSPRVYPGLSDASAVPPTAPSAGWEPAIVVNYPVEPSLRVDPEPPVRPGEPSPDFEHAGPAYSHQTGTDEPGPPDPTVNLSDRMDEAHELEAEASRPLEAERKSVRRKRASVPSWDEIMFGGPKRTS
jgi:hypothetical protein